jgi:hypothetical protein
MHDELLAIEQFDGLLEAQGPVVDWRDQDTCRPHAPGLATFAEYTQRKAKNKPQFP